MTEPISVPEARTVVTEQAWAVGLAVRRELLAAGAFLVSLLLALTIIGLAPGLAVQIDIDGPIVLNPEDALGYMAVIVGLVFPLAVWKGEAPFGDTQLWTLPVDRQRHALIKVGAGWAWLTGLIAAGMLCLALGVLVSGGSVGESGTRLLFVDGPGTTRPVPWSTPWWQWVMPFTAATAAYLLASALILGTKRPWFWAAGAWLLFLGLGVAAEGGGFSWLEAAFRVVFLESFDFAASGGTDTLRGHIMVPGDRAIRAWWGLPSFGRWAGATAGWLGLGLVGVWAAARRHREG